MGGRVDRLAELGHIVAGDRPDRDRPAARDPRDILDELSRNVSRLTDVVERFRGNALNHVLFSGTGQIPASGEPFTTQTVVPFATVVILPIASDVRIEASPASNAPLGARAGRGMWWCPASAGLLEIPLVGTVLAVYGAPGAFFNLALLTTPAE